MRAPRFRLCAANTYALSPLLNKPRRGKVRGMKLGIVGLGKMGLNMALRLLEGGHQVVASDHHRENLDALKKAGGTPVEGEAELVAKIESPRIIWLMIGAGNATERAVKYFSEQLKADDILIDGGNANYHDSKRRHALCKEHGIHFLDVGTSGGIWGRKIGYCLMIGGDTDAVRRVEPLFKTLAPPDGYLHAGGPGAGHYVKMIHNGIEYGMLQAYAEGFELLHGNEFNLDLLKISHLWNQGSVVRSWLLELAELTFEKNGQLEDIRDYVEDSGEGRWTIAEAITRNIPAPVITLSLLARLRSRQETSFSAKFIAALRNEFGGHAVKKA